MTQRMLTVKEVSEVIGVSPWAIRQWVKQGKVPGAVKFGNSIRIPEAFLTSGTPEANADADAAEGVPTPVAAADDYDPRDDWPTVEPAPVEPVAPLAPPEAEPSRPKKKASRKKATADVEEL